MKKLRPHLPFEHRPSTVFQSSSRSTVPFQKKTSVNDTASEEKVLEIKEFNYVITQKQEKRSDGSIIFSENGRKTAQLDKDHLAKTLKKRYVGFDSSSLENILRKQTSNEYLECMYFISVYVIHNYFGARGPNDGGPRKLLDYVNQFPLPSKVKNECSEKAKKLKAPEYMLIVKVKEAANLIPTDSDGLSDPYCKLWMNNQKDIMVKTSVKGHTLNPKWDENFGFRLGNLDDDVVHIEVWDEDPQGFAANISQIKNIKGCRGLCLFCRECCRNVCCCGVTGTDDFVGKTDVSVKDISSEGIDTWLPVKDAKGRCIGQLHILAEFKAFRPKHMLNALKRHLLLLKVCLQQSLEQNKESHFIIARWEQLLSHSAFSLIFQHAIQSSLTLLEDMLCKFIVFVNLVKNQFSVNYQFLYSICDETHECAQSLSNTDYGFENSVEDLYQEAINSVYDLCKSVIISLHTINFIDDDNQCTEFEFVLRCITLCHDILGKEESLWSVFKSEAVTWFQQLASEINNVDSNKKTEFYLKTLSFICSYHSAVDKVIRNIFPDKNYTQLTYEVLDSIMTENLKPHVVSLVEESLHSFGKVKEIKMQEALDIFLKVKDLYDYVSKSIQTSGTELQIEQFREWFGCSIVNNWFKWKQEIIISQIKQIVDDDKLENKLIECATRLEKQSYSVKLTTNLIQKELIELHNSVYHPKYQNYDHIFLEAFHVVCMKYSEFLLDLIYSRNILSNFHLIGKKQLSVMANNLWSLAIFVKKTIEDAVSNIPTNFYNTKFSLESICYILCSDICKEFEQSIVMHIKDVVESNSKKKQKQALSAYSNRIQYLFFEETLPHMAFEIYLLFTREVWKTIINAVQFFKEAYKDSDVLTVFQRCRSLYSKKPTVSSGLIAVLTETEKLIFIDDRGRLKQFMWSDEYKMLKNDLHQSLIIT